MKAKHTIRYIADRFKPPERRLEPLDDQDRHTIHLATIGGALAGAVVAVVVYLLLTHTL